MGGCDEFGFRPGAATRVAEVRFNMAIDWYQFSDGLMTLRFIGERLDFIPSRTLKPTLFQSAIDTL